jgi:hypothetical protein
MGIAEAFSAQLSAVSAKLQAISEEQWNRFRELTADRYWLFFT